MIQIPLWVLNLLPLYDLIYLTLLYIGQLRLIGHIIRPFISVPPRTLCGGGQEDGELVSLAKSRYALSFCGGCPTIYSLCQLVDLGE